MTEKKTAVGPGPIKIRLIQQYYKSPSPSEEGETTYWQLSTTLEFETIFPGLQLRVGPEEEHVLVFDAIEKDARTGEWSVNFRPRTEWRDRRLIEAIRKCGWKEEQTTEIKKKNTKI
ncbi:MAG TPA: hypothetical protein VGP13_00790 [Candidatus Paceibacterota bacterium]|jgi:hypothetical protein|nr:hypothetical protein [Candidatus Paceibacterota bacterium]